MQIKFLRIDDRLVHGQVIVGWLPKLEVKCIIIANSKISDDLMRQEMIRLTVPNEIDVYFAAPQNVCKSLSEYIVFETLILVSSPKDAYECIINGIVPVTLNIGGLHARPGKTAVFDSLYINDEDKDYFYKLKNLGYKLSYQPTPQNEIIYLDEIL